jgi:hypothetical protein
LTEILLFAVVDDTSCWPERRRGSLSERDDAVDDDDDDVDNDDTCVDVDASSLDSFLGDAVGTDVVDGTRPSRLKR